MYVVFIGVLIYNNSTVKFALLWEISKTYHHQHMVISKFTSANHAYNKHFF